MASLCSDSGSRGTSYRVLIRTPSGKRHTIRLGRVSKRVAETARRMIELLESAKVAGHSPDVEVSEWVGRLGNEIHHRLHKAGLVRPKEKAADAVVTLGQHLGQYFGSLGHQKPNTARNYIRSRRLLEKHFGGDRPLGVITEGDADGYRRWLLDNYAQATTSVELRRARQFFKAAVRQRLIAVNPFADVPCGSQSNESRTLYVPAEDIEKVIAVCPDNDWRLIFALPRYGGVRFPSEVEDLKWDDVDFDNSRFTVHEKKVEHHPGRGRRAVPIFAELRPHLERAYRERPPGAVYVVPKARHGSNNLRTQAHRLIAKAKVAVWPKVFVNLRGSCSDDLARRGIPDKAIDSWIGNTARLRDKHYHSVRREDWDAVTKQAAQIPAPSVPVSGCQEPSTVHEDHEKTLDVSKNGQNLYPHGGSNKRSVARKKPQKSQRRGANSGSKSRDRSAGRGNARKGGAA